MTANSKAAPDPKHLEDEPRYTIGRNPHLADFVRQHQTNDEREAVAAFTQTQKVSKASALYNMHTYWSKKPHEAIESYVRHYTEPGDIVLDPFSGSGGTSVAALMNNRKAIAIDLSPAATFISYHYTHPVNPKLLEKAFERLMERVGAELDWLYETRLDGVMARTGYTVYSAAFVCSSCAEKVVVFNANEINVPKIDKKGNPVFKDGVAVIDQKLACKNCGFTFTTRELSKFKRLPPTPVRVSLQGAGGRVEREPNADDLAKLAEIEAQEIPYWVPEHEFQYGFETHIKRNLPHQGVTKVRHLFSRRNLWALSTLMAGIQLEENAEMRRALEFLFAGNVFNATRMQRYREAGGGFQMGTYYLPPFSVERHQRGTVGRKLGDIVEGFTSAFGVLESDNCVLSTQSATDLSNIPDSSIDYVFTDPPYAGQVQYGELNFVWEAWLNLPTDWHDQEIIENKTRGKTIDDWRVLMTAAFREVERVLKPGRWCTITYHDTDSSTWELLHTIMRDAGFIPDDADGVVAIDATQKSYNQMKADKNAQTDLVVNFYKPRFTGDTPPSSSNSRDLTATGSNTSARVMSVLLEHLQSNPGQTKPQLYDAAISRLVRSGQIESMNFDGILEKHASHFWVLDGRYFLPGQDVSPEDGGLYGWEGIGDETPERKVVGFIRNLLRDHSLRYSDIQAEYNTKKSLNAARAKLVNANRSLEDILNDGFVFDDDHSAWRLPTEQERIDLYALIAARQRRQFQAWLEAARGNSKPRAVSSDVLIAMFARLSNEQHYALIVESADLFERLHGALPDEADDYALVARTRVSQGTAP